MQLAVSCVPKNGRRRLVILEHLLQASKKVGQLVGRHRQVFDEWERSTGAAQAVQARNHLRRQLPKELDLVPLHRQASVKGPTVHVLHPIHHSPQVVAHLPGVVSLLLDQHNGFHVRGDESAVARIGFASDAEQPPVEQITGAHAHASGFKRNSSRGVQSIAKQEHDPLVTRQRIGAHRRFGDQRERSLGTNQQAGEVDLPIGQDVVQLIARTIHLAPRAMRLDHRRLATREVRDTAHQRVQAFRAALAWPRVAWASRASRTLVAGFFLHGRVSIQFDDLSVRQHHLQRFDPIPGGPVTQPVAASPVQRQHASHGGHMRHRRIGAEEPTSRGEELIQLSMHDAGLHTDAVGLNVEYSAHEMREVNDQARPQRFAGESRSRAAGVNGNAVVGGIANRSDHVGRVSRTDHAERANFVKAGIRRVQLHMGVVAEDFPMQQAAKVSLNAFPFRVHGGVPAGLVM
jgi:hypothetical protein